MDHTHNTSYDVELDVNGNILFPVMLNCTNCNTAAPGNFAIGRVYRFDESGAGVPFASTNLPYVEVANSTSGYLHGYDLKMRVCPTADGGFGVVSTKESLLPNPGPVLCDDGSTTIQPDDYWNTDAYVAKVDVDGNILWQKIFDEGPDESPVPYPGDWKKQECMYSISEAEDGGFVISGNYSANFDDCYLVKLYGDCQPNVGYDLDDYSVPSGTTTWSGVSYIIQGSIIINSGCSLVVNNGSVIEFADSRQVNDADVLATNNSGLRGKIIINPGGTLTVDNSTLRGLSGCPLSNMWEGIEMIDITSLLYLRNGAKIQDAMFGVCAGEIEYNLAGEPYPTAVGGGRIQAVNTEFLNCRNSVYFAPYSNQQGSVFRKCNFINDASLTSTGYPLADPNIIDAQGNHLGNDAFVTLNGVKIIGFSGSNFTSALTGKMNLRGDGIRSVDSKYIVAAACTTWSQNLCTGTVPSTFTGLHTAIKASASNPLNTVNIYNTIFTNNFGAVQLNGLSHTKIASNTFNYWLDFPCDPQSPAFCQPYFVYLNGCTEFDVEENQFYGAYPEVLNQHVWASVFNNSGNGNSTCYKNSYNGVTVAAQAQVNNPNLSVECNTNTYNTSADIAVTSGTVLNPQGASGDPVGNKFSQITGVWDIFNNNSVPTLLYHYFQTSLQDPTGYTNNVFPQSTSPDNACPSRQSTTISDARSSIEEYKSMNSTLNDNIDGGDTEGLLSHLANTTELYNITADLLEASPYLSDTVMLATINRYNNNYLSAINLNIYLSAVNLRDIIVANGRYTEIESNDTAITKPVRDAIAAASMPDSIRDAIEASYIGTSPRQLLEGEIRYNKHQIGLLQNHIIRYFLADTFDEQNTNMNLDSVIAYIDTAGNTEGKMLLVSALEEKGELNDAATLNDELRDSDTLLVNFCAMHDIIIDLIQNEQTPYIMRDNSTLREDVEEIAADTTLIGYLMARAMLSMVFGNQYPVWIEEIDTSGGHPRLEQSNTITSNKNEIYSFNIYPNPAGQSVTVEVTMPENSEQGQFIIYDFLGRKEVSYNLQKGKNIFNINVANVSPGIYLCLSQNNSGILEKKKLIILNTR